MSKRVLLYGENADFMGFIKSILSEYYVVIAEINPKIISTYDYKIINFDYIIVCESKRNKSNDEKAQLIHRGISENCIIQPYALSWKERFFDSTYEDILCFDMGIDGLIIGMSQSQWAILPELLDKRFFKMSLGGCDLFTSLLWLVKLIENKKEFIQRLKYLIIDMPYFIFNWSILETTHFYYRIGYFNTIDLNQYCEDKQKKCYLQQYDIMKQMFFEKYQQGFVDFHSIETHLDDIEASWIWGQLNKNIISQNIKYYEKLIKNILAVNPNIKICNVIIPCERDYIKHNKTVIDIARDNFFNILSSYNKCPNLTTLDLVKYSNYMPKSHFLDYLHLNYNGAKQFSKYLNKKFKTSLY